MRTAAYTIRPYRDEDEAAVLCLLDASLGAGPGGSRPAEFFRWKHLESPFGRSFMLLAEASDRIIGLRAFMRWRFAADGSTFRAVRAVDTATHPDFQGRGVFSKLTRTAIDLLGEECDFIFNTPNEKSLPGYLKMGWTPVAQIPIYLRPARPVCAAVHALLGPPERGRASAHPAAVALDRIHAPADGRISTPRSDEYVLWRYVRAPLLDYRAVRTERGAAIFRVRPRRRLVEATVSEVFAPDPAEAARLLKLVRRSSGADHLTAHFARGTIGYEALRRQRFVRLPQGTTLVARPLREGIEPDPLAFGNWSLAVGDFEVF
jgi:GNAT superfamily N-acetyltransferase